MFLIKTFNTFMSIILMNECLLFNHFYNGVVEYDLNFNVYQKIKINKILTLSPYGLSDSVAPIGGL